MAIVKITADNFGSEVESYGGAAVVDFYADWCGPCRMLAPILEELANEDHELKICKVNTDEAPSLAIKYGIDRIPTLLVFKNGVLVNTLMGVQSKEAILAAAK